MTNRSDYWLPWWWDFPQSAPIVPVGFDVPDLSPPDISPPMAAPANTTLGGGVGGGPPPAAPAATVQVTGEELREIKRRNKLKRGTDD